MRTCQNRYFEGKFNLDFICRNSAELIHFTEANLIKKRISEHLGSQIENKLIWALSNKCRQSSHCLYMPAVV